jgi:hypothetical protein
MKRVSSYSVLVLALAATPPGISAPPKERKPQSWAWVSRQVVDVRSARNTRKHPFAHLGHGALVEVYQSVATGSVRWSQIRVLDLEKLEPRLGWVDSSEAKPAPLEEFPSDADLLTMLGGIYLDDSAKSHIQIARFLVLQGATEPGLLCLVGSPALADFRLQVFRRAQGKFVSGPHLEFPFSEMKPGITTLETRDLMGDGTECLVTHEPFDLGPENRGVNLVIRRIEATGFSLLWKAPLEYRNLASFPAHYHALEPGEQNIGAASTVTKGTVEFLAHGRLSEPVWKGKVEFYVFGREKPVDSISIKKVCPWDGTKFAPLY